MLKILILITIIIWEEIILSFNQSTGKFLPANDTYIHIFYIILRQRTSQFTFAFMELYVIAAIRHGSRDGGGGGRNK